MATMGTMERILRLMGEKKASDVYLSAHAPAMIKINGQCIPINSQVLPPDATRNLLAEVLPPCFDVPDEPIGHVQFSTGEGAGMGISLAYRSCDHLVFNLAPGKRTEIIALIDVRANPGAASMPVPGSSYNVFVERA